MKIPVLILSIALLSFAMEISTITDADPQKCIEQKCPTQWATCQKDAKCLAALDDCQKKCGTKASCWTLCLPSKGSQSAIDVAKCAQANGCDKAVEMVKFDDPQDCIMKYCEDVEELCRNDRRCLAVLDECDKKCNTTKNCWTDCLTKSKNSNATNYIKCLYDHKCINVSALASNQQLTTLEDPQQCIQQKCPTQWAACQKDPKCIPALNDCQKKCGTKASCWALCLPGKGSQPAIDVAKCAQANGCI